MGHSMNSIDLYLIKPTRYDDDGYPLQWMRSLVPSNSLACVAALVRDAAERGVLSKLGEVRVKLFDEINTKVDVPAIIAGAQSRKTLVFLVGVQTNQFPRAMDIARPLRAAGIPVCVGGFHVSGCLSMLKTLPPDLVEAQNLGISFFTGEAEERRIDEVLLDGFSGRLKPIYNHLAHAPNLSGEPVPLLHLDELANSFTKMSSFDLGRGCPFECSFCTIINVQGRKSRFRTPDDLEAIVRENAKIGVKRFFLTDDNFARNKHWEILVDRLIALRAEGLGVYLHVQVDTMAYKIPRFVDKLVQAGGAHIFIGLENINSDNLEASKKRQNRIEDYKEMVLAWKKHHVVVTCGYIIGFPNDTRESILRDVETIKRELAIDNIYVNYLTPLPGSEDHKKLYESGAWMDPDMNKYTLSHRVTHHNVMSDQDWESAYREFHARYFDFAHMETVLRRMVALRINLHKATINRLLCYRESVMAEGVSMLESGYVRVRRRRQRRSGMPLQSPLVFYPWHWFKTTKGALAYLITMTRLHAMLRRILADPNCLTYKDAAITPARPDGAENHLVEATRVTDYARRRMTNGAKTRVAAEAKVVAE
jgi:pyruvate-formate lyase-activating enzyme